MEKQLNSLQGKILACAKMAPRKVEECARSGHVTGQRSLRGRGSRKGLDWALTNTMLFSDYHLAKLNPQMSYELFGLFVTEISYMPGLCLVVRVHYSGSSYIGHNIMALKACFHILSSSLKLPTGVLHIKSTNFLI